MKIYLFLYFIFNSVFKNDLINGFQMNRLVKNNNRIQFYHSYRPYRNNFYERVLRQLNSKNQTERDEAILSENDKNEEEDTNSVNGQQNHNLTDLYRRKVLSLRGLGLEIELVEQNGPMPDNFKNGLEINNDDDERDREQEREQEPEESDDFGFGPRGRETNNVDGFELIRNSSYNFNSIGGYDLVKSELTQCIDLLKNYKKYKRFNVRTPKGLVLEGPPGTGKTLFAKALAGEANCSFIPVAGSDFTRKYVGEGSQRIKKLFSLAKKHKPTIIFIDELDSIGRRRSGDGESSSSERDNTLNSLLVELDGFSNTNGIFVVSATNRLDIIDTALLRPGRIDKKIKIDLPDFEARRKIIKIHIRGKPHDKSVNITELTELFEGLTGAQIENILNEAMLLALRNNYEFFTIKDINVVYDRMYVGWQPLNHEFNDDLINRIAVHEMGHAIVGMLSQYHSKLNKVVINLSSPNSPGYTMFKPTRNNLFFKETLFEHLMILLAGRLAEEEIFGLSITTGASNDLREVNKLASDMIELYGMGTHIIYPSTSEKYKILKDDDIIKLIEYAQYICKEIIKEARELIVYTSKILIKNKTITHEELENIINEKHSDILKFRDSEETLKLYTKWADWYI